MTSKYRQTLDFLYRQLPMFQRIGPAAFKKDLSNTLMLCRQLDDPHHKFSSIHIAGTNGKGSVAHMLAAILTASGYKTGLYTSPHYRDFRERIKINGQLVPKKEIVDFVEQYKAIFESVKPSFFEWSVAMAFHYFAKEKVDIAVVETGLGGRLDSTNILSPLLSIITNIGYDHQQFLGDTLPEIAAEKAGIIKHRIPVVIGETQPEVKMVFDEVAGRNDAPIYYADSSYEVIPKVKNGSHVQYEVKRNGHIIWDRLPLNAIGDYQRKNLVTVLASLDVLSNHYEAIFPPERLAIRNGLKDLKKLSGFIGRWEYLSHSPRILCDSAHNEQGIRMAMQSLRDMQYDQLHIVLGLVNDKDPGPVLSLFPKEATYYFAKADVPRGLNAEMLREQAKSFGLSGRSYASVKRALAAAKRSAGEKDLIYVGGSIFVVAEVV